jgi:hypothetical protein
MLLLKISSRYKIFAAKNVVLIMKYQPVAGAERSKTCTVFARSEAGIVGSNPTEGIYVWGLFVCV